MALKDRVEHLESRLNPPCGEPSVILVLADGRPEDHVIAVEAEGRTFTRQPNESLEQLQERVVSQLSGNVHLLMTTYSDD